MADKHINENEYIYYEPYKNFALSLRAWFIAYGIGAPIIFLSNEGTQKAISNYEGNKFLISLFLTGVVIQIIQALLYKHAMWHLHMGEGNPDYHTKWLYKGSEKITEVYWLEATLDLSTVIVYVLATWHTFKALL